MSFEGSYFHDFKVVLNVCLQIAYQFAFPIFSKRCLFSKCLFFVLSMFYKFKFPKTYLISCLRVLPLGGGEGGGGGTGG